MATAGSSVIGVDWRVPLDEARRRIGHGLAVQGNLDPAMCLTTWEGRRRDARGSGPGRRRARSHLQFGSRRPSRNRPGNPRAGWSGWSMPKGGPGWSSPDESYHLAAHRRTGHGPWHARLAGGHRSPSTPPSDGGARRLLSCWTNWWAVPGHRRDLAADPADQGPGRGSVRRSGGRRPRSLHGGLRHQVRHAVHRRGDGRRWWRAESSESSESCSRPINRHSGRASTTVGRRAVAYRAPSVDFTSVPSWHRAQGFSELLADRTAAALASMDTEARRSTSVFFTAHSLPLRVVGEGDPYPDQVAESAAEVAALDSWTRRPTSRGKWRGRARDGRRSPGSDPISSLPCAE